MPRLNLKVFRFFILSSLITAFYLSLFLNPIPVFSVEPTNTPEPPSSNQPDGTLTSEDVPNTAGNLGGTKFTLYLAANFSGTPKLKIWKGQTCSGNDYWKNSVSMHQDNNDPRVWTYLWDSHNPSISTGPTPHYAAKAYNGSTVISGCNTGGTTDNPQGGQLPSLQFRIDIDTTAKTVKISWNEITGWPANAGYYLSIFQGGPGLDCIDGYDPLVTVPFTGPAANSYTWTNVAEAKYWARLSSLGVQFVSCTPFEMTKDKTNTATGIPINLKDVDSCSSGSHGTCQTGVGSLSDDPATFVNQILRIAIGIAAGIAFLLLIFGGFRLSFSHGDPKAVQEARDVITGAIVGLLIIVFSVFLLRLIGIDILGLPI